MTIRSGKSGEEVEADDDVKPEQEIIQSEEQEIQSKEQEIQSKEQEIQSSQDEEQTSEANPMVLPRFVSNALYIADLDPDFVSQALLFDLFSQVGNVLSVRLCTNSKSSGDSSLRLCHAYVNFNTVEEACSAWQTLNYKNLNGTSMRIMFSNLDPASRYNKNANLVIKNLEESIDSEALHHTFSAIGVVLSSKVQRDRSGKSLGYGFVQFQDEEDAQRAIQLINSKLLKGKKVYLGPFIPRSIDRLEAAMNLNPLDLNPAHNSACVPVQVVEFRNMNSTSYSPSNSSIDSTGSDDEVGSHNEVDDDEEPSSLGDDDYEARIRARARGADMIEAARAAIIAQKRAAMPHIDPSYVPSSEPWAPQPWSVETLRANIASSHLPEERLAMLGATLLPMVWKCTETFASDVTNELVKLDMEDIVHLMESAEALQEKVEGTKKIIIKQIQDQAPFVPKTPPTRSSAPDEDLVDDEAPTVAPARLLPLQIWTRVLELGKFRKGTGFFDVSQTQTFRVTLPKAEVLHKAKACVLPKVEVLHKAKG